MSGASQVIKIQEVVEKSGLGRSTIFARSKLGTFPRQLKLGERSSGWLAHEVEEWISQRVVERDSGKGL
jgi:prophage regulatory protein